MHSIKRCVLAFQMVLSLAGCGGGGDDGGGSGYSVAIVSADLLVNGGPAATETILSKETGGTFSVNWNVSFSNPSNLYRVELVLIDAFGAEKQAFDQNCGSEAGVLYNCGTSATVDCTVGSSSLACVIGDSQKNIQIGNDAVVEFRACIYNASLAYECKKQPLNLRLVGGTSTSNPDVETLTPAEIKLLRNVREITSRYADFMSKTSCIR